MAIERNTDYNESEQPVMGEDDSETVDIPASLLGDKSVEPGDVIRLEVVSSDPDSEMITVKYATPKESVGGIDKAVAEFEA